MTPDDAPGGDLAPRLARVRALIDAAARRAGRDPSDVTLLPVSKTRPVDAVANLARLGVTCFGENRPQELAAKAAALDGGGLTWVLIGPLQRNKAGLAAQWAGQFQALDSLAVAEALDRRLQRVGRGIGVMVEVNTSGEPTKHGVAPDEVLALARGLKPYASLRPAGLMTVAALSDDEAVVRGCFSGLRGLRDRLLDADDRWRDLSMGMSSDYQWAIEEGATVVRVGSAIFGPRNSA